MEFLRLFLVTDMCQTTADDLRRFGLIEIDNDVFKSTFFGKLMNRYLLDVETMREFANVCI